MGRALALAVLFFATTLGVAQEESLFGRVSPKAKVSQVIGTTEVTVTYSRPHVRGRKVWGALVPYGAVWRAGANEATTLRFTDSVKVDGKPLPAGTYALFVIPEVEQWTFIFSRSAKQWGPYEYRPQDDVLRIYRKPRMVREHEEWLSYSFTPSSPASAYLTLRWEKLEVSFLVEVDVDVVASARLRHLLAQARTHKDFANIAENLMEAERDLPKALEMVDKALKLKEDAWYLYLKAQIVRLLGDRAKALPLLERAQTLALASKAPARVLGPIQETLHRWKTGALDAKR